jgi:hypothetical protein
MGIGIDQNNKKSQRRLIELDGSTSNQELRAFFNSISDISRQATKGSNCPFPQNEKRLSDLDQITEIAFKA